MIVPLTNSIERNQIKYTVWDRFLRCSIDFFLSRKRLDRSDTDKF